MTDSHMSKYSPTSPECKDTNSMVDGFATEEDTLPDVESYDPTPKTKAFRQRVLDISLTAITTLIFLTAFQYIYHITIYDSEYLRHSAIASLYSEQARLTPKYHCGNSSSSARAQGCIFDISVVGWVPEPCFDRELNQRFLDWGWRFFEDQEGTREVSLERIAESAGTREPFWAQHGYHITHCELAWQRMHRAIMNGKRLTTHLLNLDHTHHCGMMTEMRDDLYSLNSQILPLLNTC